MPPHRNLPASTTHPGVMHLHSLIQTTPLMRSRRRHRIHTGLQVLSMDQREGDGEIETSAMPPRRKQFSRALPPSGQLCRPGISPGPWGNLVKLAHLYPTDFAGEDLMHISYQLTHFITDMCIKMMFIKVKNIIDLSIMLAKTNKNVTYNLV